MSATTHDGPVLAVRGLAKTFRIGFFRKKVEAVRGIDFEVRRGEIFGLLGPNGAGKTTTIKSLLGLIFPQRGSVELFGQPRSRAAMARVGYMPENPYVYQYLKPLEFLDLCGRLVGMKRAARAERGRLMIERVGLAHAIDRPIGKFSKGMMQRVGIAQALLHDPEFLILDEPMSGLDPVGRKEVRELIAEQREAGKTLLFTSHILSDVEMLCDRVGIMGEGRMKHYGTLRELLGQTSQRVEVELRGVSPALEEELGAMTTDLAVIDTHHVMGVQRDAAPVIAKALAAGAQVVAVTPARQALEDLFFGDAANDSARSKAEPKSTRGAKPSRPERPDEAE